MPVITIVSVAKKATRRPSTPASRISTAAAVAEVVRCRASAGGTVVATVAVVACSAAEMPWGQVEAEAAVVVAAVVALQNPRASGARSESILVNRLVHSFV